MSEYPKFIPGGEKVIGSVQFREMDPGVEYVIVPQPFRSRVVTYAPDYSPVKVDFFPDKEDGSRSADIRDLALWDSRKILTEEDGEARMHGLAAFLISQKIIPFVPHDILLPLRYPEPGPEEAKQPDPTDPMAHLKDYFPSGIPTKRKRR